MAYSTAQGYSPFQRIQVAAVSYMNRPTANSTAAIIIWVLGALATKTFLKELDVISTFTSTVDVCAAFVFQALLTLLEGPIWHTHLRNHRTRFILSVGALTVDTCLNTAGVWYFLQNLGNTTFWQALASATNTQNGPAAMTIFAISALIGLAISAGPEALWDL